MRFLKLEGHHLFAHSLQAEHSLVYLEAIYGRVTHDRDQHSSISLTTGVL
jgi:hypothetical protein